MPHLRHSIKPMITKNKIDPFGQCPVCAVGHYIGGHVCDHCDTTLAQAIHILERQSMRQNPAIVAALNQLQPGPIHLNTAQEDAINNWAADDRLWTTQDTVQVNLTTFSRTILGLQKDNGMVTHGVDCHKVTHVGEGHLHGEDDDTPYMVDGVMYCGRCHIWITQWQWHGTKQTT